MTKLFKAHCVIQPTDRIEVESQPGGIHFDVFSDGHNVVLSREDARRLAHALLSATRLTQTPTGKPAA